MPVEENEHLQMLDFITDKIATDTEAGKFKLLIGQDSNAQVGTMGLRSDINFFNAIGPFGEETANKKGMESRDFCEQHSLFFANTYFQKPCVIYSCTHSYKNNLSVNGVTRNK